MDGLKLAIKELNKIISSGHGTENTRDALRMLEFDADMLNAGIPYYVEAYKSDNNNRVISGKNRRIAGWMNNHIINNNFTVEDFREAIYLIGDTTKTIGTAPPTAT